MNRVMVNSSVGKKKISFDPIGSKVPNSNERVIQPIETKSAAMDTQRSSELCCNRRGCKASPDFWRISQNLEYRDAGIATENASLG